MKYRGKFTEQVNEPHYADSKPGVADGGSLVIAVTVAMLLGVVCGLWLSARLASAAMEAAAIPASSRPIINANRSESVATKSAPDDSEDVSAVVNKPTPTTAARESDDEKEAAASTPPRAPAEKAEGARGVSNAARSSDEAETPGETADRKNAMARGTAFSCHLYASASTLIVRNG